MRNQVELLKSQLKSYEDVETIDESIQVENQKEEKGI